MAGFSEVQQALTSELEHARQGIRFYENRIEKLERLMQQVAELDGAPANGAMNGGVRKTGKRGGAGKSEGRKADLDTSKRGAARSASGKSKAKNGPGLPKTNAEFWRGLLSTTPISNKELLSSAISALKIQPNETDLKKLKLRVANAINLMTRDGSMISEGAGRDRRFSIQA